MKTDVNLLNLMSNNKQQIMQTSFCYQGKDINCFPVGNLNKRHKNDDHDSNKCIHKETYAYIIDEGDLIYLKVNLILGLGRGVW